MLCVCAFVWVCVCVSVCVRLWQKLCCFRCPRPAWRWTAAQPWTGCGGPSLAARSPWETPTDGSSSTMSERYVSSKTQHILNAFFILFCTRFHQIPRASFGRLPLCLPGEVFQGSAWDAKNALARLTISPLVGARSPGDAPLRGALSMPVSLTPLTVEWAEPDRGHH